MEAKMISRDEVARMLGVTRQTVSNWAERGALKGHMIGSRMMFNRLTVEQLFDSLDDMKAMEERVREDTKLLKELKTETDQMIYDKRAELRLLRKGGMAFPMEKNLICAMIDAAGEDLISSRDASMMMWLVDGASVEDVAVRYHVSPGRVVQIVSEASRKMADMRNYSEMKRRLADLELENEQLKSSIAELHDRVRANEKVQEREMDGEVGEFARLMATGVHKLDLPVRAINSLKWNNVGTLGDLVRLSETDILRFRNMGKKTLRCISELVESMGLEFSMDVDALVAADVANKMQREGE